MPTYFQRHSTFSRAATSASLLLSLLNNFNVHVPTMADLTYDHCDKEPPVFDPDAAKRALELINPGPDGVESMRQCQSNTVVYENRGYQR